MRIGHQNWLMHRHSSWSPLTFLEASKRRHLWAEVVSHKGNVIYSAPVREIVGIKTSEETFTTESE